MTLTSSVSGLKSRLRGLMSLCTTLRAWTRPSVRATWMATSKMKSRSAPAGPSGRLRPPKSSRMRRGAPAVMSRSMACTTPGTSSLRRMRYSNSSCRCVICRGRSGPGDLMTTRWPSRRRIARSTRLRADDAITSVISYSDRVCMTVLPAPALPRRSPLWLQVVDDPRLELLLAGCPAHRGAVEAMDAELDAELLRGARELDGQRRRAGLVPDARALAANEVRKAHPVVRAVGRERAFHVADDLVGDLAEQVLEVVHSGELDPRELGAIGGGQIALRRAEDDVPRQATAGEGQVSIHLAERGQARLDARLRRLRIDREVDEHRAHAGYDLLNEGRRVELLPQERRDARLEPLQVVADELELLRGSRDRLGVGAVPEDGQIRVLRLDRRHQPARVVHDDVAVDGDERQAPYRTGQRDGRARLGRAGDLSRSPVSRA